MVEAGSTALEDDTDQQPQGRKGWQRATPIVMLALYVVGPLVLIPTFGPDHAVIPVFILVFGTAAAAGLVDGLTYRTTASLPILAGLGFGIAKILYFNDGTLIYAFICAAIAAATMYLGDAVAHRGKE